MVYDKIDNIEIYNGLSPSIYEGLKFLQHIDPNIDIGAHKINARIVAIVSEYNTKTINDYGYEAHKDYIDIQYLIYGFEKVRCLPLEYLKESKPYNKEIDAAFYMEYVITPLELMLGNGFFTILFPQDGHMPQLCVDEPIIVKKVVVKVKIGE